MSPARETLMGRYNRLSKMSNDLYRHAARACGMPETALWILYSLREPEIRTQAELCSVMFQSKQSVHSALQKLVEDGYVTLTPAPENHRQKHISLTPSGDALARSTADCIRRAETQALDSLTPAEADAFLNGYETLLTRLEVQLQNCLKPEETPHEDPSV